MSKGSILFAAVAGAIALALGAGCTVTATTDSPYAGCTQDTSLNCQAGGSGWRCAAGDNPENDVSNLSCSIPQPDGPDDDFCCIAWAYSSSCRPDPNVICSPPYSYGYGYSCLAGDNPATLDPTLNCSSPTPDGSNDDFCCE
jgi:hypothetical protein